MLVDWDPAYSDVKLVQSYFLLTKIQTFLRDNTRLQLDTPLFITGDFNSLPDSGMYELYSKGKVSGSHRDMKSYPLSQNLVQPLILQSAYAVLNEPFSNYPAHFHGTLDYIWFTPKSLKMVTILESPTKSQLEEYVAIPSPLWSSDHLALVAKFVVKKKLDSSM